MFLQHAILDLEQLKFILFRNKGLKKMALDYLNGGEVYSYQLTDNINANFIDIESILNVKVLKLQGVLTQNINLVISPKQGWQLNIINETAYSVTVKAHSSDTGFSIGTLSNGIVFCDAYSWKGASSSSSFSINSYPAKASLVNNDVFLIEDSASSYDKKKVTYSNVLSAINALSGDVSGLYSANTVNKIKNININSTSPTDGQVLTYNSSVPELQWADQGGAYNTFTIKTTPSSTDIYPFSDSTGTTKYKIPFSDFRNIILSNVTGCVTDGTYHYNSVLQANSLFTGTVGINATNVLNTCTSYTFTSSGANIAFNDVGIFRGNNISVFTVASQRLVQFYNDLSNKFVINIFGSGHTQTGGSGYLAISAAATEPQLITNRTVNEPASLWVSPQSNGGGLNYVLGRSGIFDAHYKLIPFTFISGNSGWNVFNLEFNGRLGSFKIVYAGVSPSGETISYEGLWVKSGPTTITNLTETITVNGCLAPVSPVQMLSEDILRLNGPTDLVSTINIVGKIEVFIAPIDDF